MPNFIEQFEIVAAREEEGLPTVVEGMRQAIRRRHLTHAAAVEILTNLQADTEQPTDTDPTVPHIGHAGPHLHIVGDEEAAVAMVQ
jgi:hypothetical protein